MRARYAPFFPFFEPHELADVTLDEVIFFIKGQVEGVPLHSVSGALGSTLNTKYIVKHRVKSGVLNKVNRLTPAVTSRPVHSNPNMAPLPVPVTFCKLDHIHPFVRSFNYLSIRSFSHLSTIYLFSHVFIYPSIHPSIHSFIHSRMSNTHDLCRVARLTCPSVRAYPCIHPFIRSFMPFFEYITHCLVLNACVGAVSRCWLKDAFYIHRVIPFIPVFLSFPLSFFIPFPVRFRFHFLSFPIFLFFLLVLQYSLTNWSYRHFPDERDVPRLLQLYR